MKKRGFTLVEIMIVVAIIALLAAIAIPNLLRARANANETAAQATLKTIATGAESFAAANNGTYPDAVADLTGATPAYLNENYCDGTTRSGYVFACTFNADGSGYSVTGRPVSCTTTGTRSWTITTGAVLAQDAACTASGGGG